MGGALSGTASAWLVLALAAAAANVPFVNERFLALIPVSGAAPAARAVKSLGLRLLELALLYAATLGVGWLIERRLGQIAPQGWEFYVVTASLFLVLAFPGFTWRYLLKRKSMAARQSGH